MKIVQLETFVVVAEELHFRRAAERLFTQPSTVSTQIAQLEAEYGTPLFIRNSRNVSLSPAGEVLLEKAKATLASIDDLSWTARMLSADGGATLTVGVMDEGIGELATIVDKAYRARFDRAQLTVEVLDYPSLRQSLIDGVVDVSIVDQADGVFDDEAYIVPLIAEPRVAAFAPDHQLAARDSIGVDELLDVTPIVRSNFQERYPNTALEIFTLDYQTITERLTTHEIDIAIVGVPNAWFTHSTTVDTPLYEEGRCAVVPVDHPLADQLEIHSDQLLDEPFLRVKELPEPLGAFFMLAERRDPQLSPDVDIEAEHMQNILGHVAAGSGIVTVTYGTERFYPRPDIAYIPAPDLEPAVLTAMRRVGEDRPHVLAFIEECVNAVRNSLDLIPGATDATQGWAP